MIRVQHLHKAFSSKIILEDISFYCPAGHIMTLFGPNGCGKSLLIRLLLGDEKPSRGAIQLESRKISHVTQGYRESLLPWKTPLDNIFFPLGVQGLENAEAQKRLNRILKALDIRLPDVRQTQNLSGGQAQLCCLLRALMIEPEILILDEPFSALDYHLKVHLRATLFEYIKAQGMTALMISHNMEDVLYLSDDILFLDGPPTRVTRCLKTHLPSFRSDETLKMPCFEDLRHEALGLFKKQNFAA